MVAAAAAAVVAAAAVGIQMAAVANWSCCLATAHPTAYRPGGL